VNKLAGLACGLALAVACGGKSKTTDTTANNGGGGTVSAGGGSGTAAAPKKELYDRLGGQAAIVAVVDGFITKVAADDRINLRFANTDIGRLKSLLVEFVCQATGGPCHYSGRDMESSHAGMDLVGDEFDALVDDLSQTLDGAKVPAKEKGELLGALGPLKPVIDAPPDRLKPVSDDKLAKANAVLAKLTDPDAQKFMKGAITAAKRGQRNYADQLFSRVELITGAATVAAAVPAFRDGAPPRITTTTKAIPDAGPQPTIVVDADDSTGLPGSLSGTITVDGKPLDGVGLVMLYPTSGRFNKRTAKYRIVEQRNKTFLPHLLAVPPGSTVAFPNYDDVYHNVFSTSATQPFDIGLYKNGQSREMKFDKIGLVRLGCNVHASMAAYIFVIDAPAYVPVDGSKEFNFRSLAPGKYKARVWSEHTNDPAEQDIVIKTGPNNIVFDVKGDAPKGPPDDKFGGSRQVPEKG
jgi:hemoglobin